VSCYRRAARWYVTSVNKVVIWIVTCPVGGLHRFQCLKWYWWRFNGYGYFWGMVAGMSSAMTIPTLVTRFAPLQNFAHAHSLNLEVSVGFGLVFLLSLIGCFLGTYLTGA